MKYRDFIEINQGFQTSVNIEYDLNKKEKIKSYIPTAQSVKILGDYLRSFYYSNDLGSRATVLIGPYGRGKSHLLLILTALTSMDMFLSEDYTVDEAKQILLELSEKIERVDKSVGSLARTIVETKVRTLPVIINSNSNDINQSFLVALKEALSRAGLQELLPTTHFDSAIALIEKWKQSFPDAYSKLSCELEKFKNTIDQLCIGLRRYNHASYEMFCKCYPSVAAGTEFNPLTNMDVVKLYMSVVNALCEQSTYSGINIIFDEFSKFLETNLEQSKMLNFKIIQDMAEASARSGKGQIHFTCVTHKGILDYSASDSFKAVEGRFQTRLFVESSEQSYELISNAIIKKDSFKSIKYKYQSEFQSVSNMTTVTSVFNDLSDDSFQQKLLYGCFPLAPLSSFVLLRITELVGQNERTLFTFLAQKDNFTLSTFVDKERSYLSFITVDYIYDYFEELLRKETFNVKVYSAWSKADAAIRQVNDDSQCRILKAIAVINIIANENLKTSPAHIKAALMMDDDIFAKAMLALQKNHILSQRDSSELVLLTANGVDIQKNVDSYVKSQISRINICEVLEVSCPLGFIMPREYNDKFSMLRCFKKIYMEAGVFIKYKNAEQLLSQYQYDGIIVYIIETDTSLTEAVKAKIKSFYSHPQIVLCMSKKIFNYEELLKKVVAIECIKKDAKEDPHYYEEADIYKDDIIKQIESIIELHFAPNSEFSYFMTCDSELFIRRQVELNKEISVICSKCYAQTPIINNEMVNKRILNSQNLKGRDLVIDWILKHSEDSKIPCIEGYGSEASIFKSTFKHTGLDTSSQVNDAGINAVLTIITEFVIDSERSKCNFSTLYQTLMAAPYGMREGVIPLFIAYILRLYKENVVLYFKDKEVELSSGILSTLNDSPENFQLLIEAGTQEKERFIDSLEMIFFDYIDKKNNSLNKVYSVVKSMQIWMRSLPEYTKKFKAYLMNGEPIQIEENVSIIRNELLKFEINSRELLFGIFSSKLSETESLDEILQNLSDAKRKLDVHISSYRQELIKKLTSVFAPGYQGGLSNSVIAWYKKMPDSTKRHMFDADTNALLSIANSQNSYNDDELLDRLVASYVSISIEDWSDSLSKHFWDGITESVNKINEFKEERTNTDDECKIAILMSGERVEKSFSTAKITPLGKTALNNLKAVFEEYNDSLEPDEQLAILATLIGNIIG